MSAMDAARATLLRALDQLEGAEKELGADPERVDAVFVYSAGRTRDDDGSWHDVGGWASTGGPAWQHAALLRRGADQLDGIMGCARGSDSGSASEDVDDDEDAPGG